jgi:hypothetical protein
VTSTGQQNPPTLAWAAFEGADTAGGIYVDD